MSMKEQYRQWAAKQVLPLFHRPEWLDVASNGTWEAVVVAEKGNIEAIWPYLPVKKMGLDFVYQPNLTPYLGPLLFYPEGQKYTSRLSFQKEVLGKLITLLPSYQTLDQRLPPGFENCLPFIWAGFQVSTRYTYILPAGRDIAETRANFRDNVRREIKKAEKQLTISPFEDVSPLITLKKDRYQQKGQDLPIDLDIVNSIAALCQQHTWGQAYGAYDAEGTLVGGALFVWDHESLYYLFGGTHAAHANSGAMSLLLWQGIQLAAEKGLQFNFEGSMIPAIERFFSAFGGTLTPYHHIAHERSKLMKLKKLLK